MYKSIIRPVLFLFAPETIHHITFSLLQLVSRIPGVPGRLRRRYLLTDPKLERKLFGLTFRSPVGLAAGFDKDARLVNQLECLGFGFIEIGTVTPRAQPGNPKPRLFRLEADQALINRMGFNNDGVLAAAVRLKERAPGIIIGGNIGKNKATPNEEAVDDYAYCFAALYPYVDYFVVNVSSPNTPGLRDLLEKEPLRQLLSTIRILSNGKAKPKPVLLKISPDLTVGQLDDVIEIVKETSMDGVIAANTTISREGLSTSGNMVAKLGAGGLSGKPLAGTTTDIIKYLRRRLGPHFPIIGVGGIMTPQDAIDKMRAGANLVQVYTGFIYEGPGFAAQINKAILQEAEKQV